MDAFGPKGVPSFLLEGVLGELQGAASRHLSHLAAGMTLELSATSSKGGKGSRAAASGGSASSGSKRSGVVVRSEESVAEEGVSSSSEDGEEGESVSSGSDGSKKVGRRKKTTAAGSEEEEEKISKIVWVQGGCVGCWGGAETSWCCWWPLHVNVWSATTPLNGCAQPPSALPAHRCLPACFHPPYTTATTAPQRKPQTP